MQVERQEETVEPAQTAKAAEQPQKPLTAQERLALLGAALLDKGGMPSDAQLSAMGIDEAAARGIQSLVLLSKENNHTDRRKVEAMIDLTSGEYQQNRTVGNGPMSISIDWWLQPLREPTLETQQVDADDTIRETKTINVTYEIVAEQVVGVRTSNGIYVKDASTHIVERINERQISISAIIDALRNPLKTGLVREDGSQQFVGEKATVAINTHTGKIVTAWPTKPKLADKLRGGK